MTRRRWFLLFLVGWSVLSFGVFALYTRDSATTSSTRDAERLEQMIKSQFEQLRQEMVTVSSSSSPPPSPSASAILLQEVACPSPRPTLRTEPLDPSPSSLPARSPSPVATPDDAWEHDQQRDHLHTRSLQENRSHDSAQDWQTKDYLKRFMKAYRSLFQGKTSATDMAEFLSPPSPVPVPVHPQSSFFMSRFQGDWTPPTLDSMGQIRQLEDERWQDLKSQFTLKGDMDQPEEEVLFSCAGEVDEHTKQETMPFSVLLVGGGVGLLTKNLARQFPTSTVIAMERDSLLVNEQQDRHQRYGIHNVLTIPTTLDQLAVERLAASQVFFRFQVLLDVVPLMRDLLPHEFEEALGQLLTLSQTTFLAIPDDRQPGVAEHAHFFEYWSDFRDLLKNACVRAGLPVPLITPIAQHRFFRIDLVRSYQRPWSLCVSANATHCTQTKETVFSFEAKNVLDGRRPVASLKDVPMSGPADWLGHAGQPPSPRLAVSSSLCAGVPLRFLLDFALVPEEAAAMAGRLAFSPLLDNSSSLYTETEKGVVLRTDNGQLSTLTLPDLLYLQQGQFLPAPFVDLAQRNLFQQNKTSTSSSTLLGYRPKDTPLPGATPPSTFWKGPSTAPASRTPSPPLGGGKGEEDLAASKQREWLRNEQEKPLPNARGVPPLYNQDGSSEEEEEYEEDAIPVKGKVKEQPPPPDVWKELPLPGPRRDGPPPPIGVADETVAPGRRRLLWDWNEYNPDSFDWSAPASSWGKKMADAEPSPPPPSAPRLLTPIDFEAYTKRVAMEAFDDAWQSLHPVVNSVRDGNGLWVVPESGTGLLASKLAKRFPSATILSLESSPWAYDQQQSLLDVLSSANVVLGHRNYYDHALLDDLGQSAFLARYQVLDAIQLLRTTCSMTREKHLAYLGQLLSLSSVTYLHVPPPAILERTSELFQVPSYYEDIQALMTATVQASHEIENLQVEKVGPHLWAIALSQADRRVMVGSTSYTVTFQVEHGSLLTSSQGQSVSQSPFGYQADVYSLLQLNVTSHLKKKMISSYFTLPPQSNMHPATLFTTYQGQLTYFAPLASSPGAFHRADSAAPIMTSGSAHERQRVLSELLGDAPFTLLHLKSGGGELSSLLSQIHPNSTVVSIEGESALHEQHVDLMEEYQLYNNLVCRRRVDSELIGIIRSSPEYFQFLLMSNVSSILQSHDDPYSTQLQDFFTRAVSLAITTYIELPSSRLISLMVSTFYPEVFPVGTMVSYEQHDHPLPAWEQSGLKLARAVLEGHGVHEVEVRQVPEGPVGVDLIEVRVLNMSRIVDHHLRLPENFMEMHSRKYELQHVHPDTFLVRQEDHSRIIYDEFGVSLVAALRLGTNKKTRERLYHQFVALPIREDMAPWNLQLRAGQLLYVDKDSVDETFDWLLPYAHQFLVAMANWRETAVQFDRCGDRAEMKMPTSMADCVGMPPDFKMPRCSDPDKPIPCPDQKCYPDYVHCLRSLSALQQANQPILPPDGQSPLDSTKTRVNIRF